MIPEIPDVEQAVRDYVSAYLTFDDRALVEYYQLPVVFISARGTVVAGGRDEAAAVVRAMHDHSRSTNHATTTIEGMSSRRLGDAIAEVSGTFLRHDANGVVTDRFGFLYLLLARGGSWRIGVAVAY